MGIKWPYWNEREIQELKKVLESEGWWRGEGKKVEEFEKRFAEHHNIRYALAVSNGTHALEIALKAVGVKEGDEVIVPVFTFVSTAVAVLNCGAIPIFADVDRETYCITSELLGKKITSRTKAIIAVHMAGNLCDMEEINNLAREKGIKVIEDAAHAQGGEWKNRKVGYYSDIATFSFQNRKVMTSGEGGALITNNKELYNKAYLIHNVGRPPGDKIYEHILLGSNDRMSEFQAAILLCQLERLDYFTNIREENARKLNEFLAEIDGIIPQKFNENCTKNTHYMYMFLFKKDCFGGMGKMEFIKAMQREGIECHVPYPLIFNTEFFKKEIIKRYSRIYESINENDYPNAAQIVKEVVWIPHYELICNEQDLIRIKEIICQIQWGN